MKVSFTAAEALRFETVANVLVAAGARSTPGGTAMSPGVPAVRILPCASVAVHPCTLYPSGLTSTPLLSKLKLPARVYALPLSPRTRKKPPPWMATFVASRVDSGAPWLNTGEIDPVTTPRPTCIGFWLPPPMVWLTRSMKVTELVLNPTVLMFARLLPITLR